MIKPWLSVSIGFHLKLSQLSHSFFLFGDVLFSTARAVKLADVSLNLGRHWFVAVPGSDSLPCCLGVLHKGRYDKAGIIMAIQGTSSFRFLKRMQAQLHKHEFVPTVISSILDVKPGLTLNQIYIRATFKIYFDSSRKQKMFLSFDNKRRRLQRQRKEKQIHQNALDDALVISAAENHKAL